MRHRDHDELDSLFHKSVGFAEISIPSATSDEFFFVNLYPRKHPNSTWFGWKEQLDRKLVRTDNAKLALSAEQNASRSFDGDPPCGFGNSLQSTSWPPNFNYACLLACLLECAHQIVNGAATLRILKGVFRSE